MVELDVFLLSYLSISFHTMSDIEDAQPSLIEYARFHGLADDHLNQEFGRYLPSNLLPPIEGASLSDFKVPCFELPLETKFILDSKAASLLASCVTSQRVRSSSDTLSDHHRAKKLRLEQPVLRTDHDNDMSRTGFRKLPKATLNLQCVELVKHKDEELASSPTLTGLSAEWDKRIVEEKLQTTREVLKALQDTLRPVFTPEMHDAIVAEELASTKVSTSTPQKRLALKLNSVLVSSQYLHRYYLAKLITSPTFPHHPRCACKYYPMSQKIMTSRWKR